MDAQGNQGLAALISQQPLGQLGGQGIAGAETLPLIETLQVGMAEQPDLFRMRSQAAFQQCASHAGTALLGGDEQRGQPLSLCDRSQAQRCDDFAGMLRNPHLIAGPGTHGRTMAAVKLVGQWPEFGRQAAVGRGEHGDVAQRVGWAIKPPLFG